MELPQSLTTIGKYAFSFSGSSPIYQKMKNDGLVVSIPASVTTIKASAFPIHNAVKNIFVLEDASSFEGADKDMLSLIPHGKVIDQRYCFQISALTKMQMKRKKCNGKLC